MGALAVSKRPVTIAFQQFALFSMVMFMMLVGNDWVLLPILLQIYTKIGTRQRFGLKK
jgi:hypothetical protein